MALMVVIGVVVVLLCRACKLLSYFVANRQEVKVPQGPGEQKKSL